MKCFQAINVFLGVGFVMVLVLEVSSQKLFENGELGVLSLATPLKISADAIDLQVKSEFEVLADTICQSHINTQRANNGKGQVSMNPQVEQAAYNHNVHMMNNNCFSHQCSGEGGLGDRLSATGYRWGGVGEIIAKGQGDCPSVVQAWMNSPGHKDIMLGNYGHVGCSGLTCNNCADRGPWWTCVFANPF